MSTLLAAVIFLPCAPIAMACLYWKGQRDERRKQIRDFADEVEHWTVVRHRG